MQLRFPKPLRPGDRIGVTAPSAGVAPRAWPRINFCIDWLPGLPTLHGDNLADTPYAVPSGLVHWTEFASSDGKVTQHDSGFVASWRSLEESDATRWKEAGEGHWRLSGADGLDVTGTLIGGCTEAMAGIGGTPYGDVREFGEAHGDLVVYLEVADADAFSVCRYLHHLRYAGWFNHAAAVLIGRTNAPASTDDGGLTQDGAVVDAIGGLDCPIVFDLEIGHVPPISRCSTEQPPASSSTATGTRSRRPGRDHPLLPGRRRLIEVVFEISGRSARDREPDPGR